MRRRIIPFLTLTVLLVAGAANARINLADIKVGAPAPAFAVKDINGDAVRLSDFKGKPVVIEWTNPECPCVSRHYDTGNMQEVQKDALQSGAVWIRVNSSAPGMPGHMNAQEAQEQAKQVGAENTITILDEAGKLGFMYGAEKTPHIFVIDAQGMLAYKGAIDNMPNATNEETPMAENHVLAALEKLSDNETPDPAATEPYGCNVMY